MKLWIKNMVCFRCKVVVEQELIKLGLTPLAIAPGEADIQETLSADQYEQLNRQLKQVGLELMTDPQVILAQKIKRTILRRVQSLAHFPRTPFSEIISTELHHDYAYLSRVFKKVEGKTIEQTLIAYKIERVKELLLIGNHSQKEISFLLGYSSPAALSNQFKKETGLTPSHFKKMGLKRKEGIDEF